MMATRRAEKEYQDFDVFVPACVCHCCVSILCSCRSAVRAHLVSIINCPPSNAVTCDLSL